MESYYWIILFLVLLVIEALTMGLTTIWFAGGALVAFLVSLLGGSFALQITAFLLVSILLLVLTRPLAKKHFNQFITPTNAQSLIGKYGLVIEEIDTLKNQGRVEVKGQEWAARTKEEQRIIEKGKTVEILEIKGVHLVVKEREVK
ncbi:MAG TPA: NfeD family protein [Candidatus Dorea intestinavium]|nr:NfeD family protein [Candidatus Dorea intestinavium]